MARRPPPGIAASSPPSRADRQVKPRIQLEESASGFRYKQTDSDAHLRVKPPDSAVERPPTAGWAAAHSRPGTAAGSQLSRTPRTPAATPPGPRPANPADSGGGDAAGPPGRPEARAMARKPPPGTAAPSPPSGGGKRYWIASRSAGREVEPAFTGRSRRSQAGATAPNHGTLPTPQRRLTRTEPANYELAHPSRSPHHSQAVTSAKCSRRRPPIGPRCNIRVTQPPPSPGPKPVPPRTTTGGPTQRPPEMTPRSNIKPSTSQHICTSKHLRLGYQHYFFRSLTHHLPTVLLHRAYD
jgi:hypothetical protein